MSTSSTIYRENIMAFYGVLTSSDPRSGNTGLESELSSVFSAPLSIDSNQVAFETDTVTLKRRARRSEPQRWEIDTAISRLGPSTNYLVQSVVCGNTEQFFVRMPQPPETFYMQEGIAAKANADYGAMSENVGVVHASLFNNPIPRGMFVQFAGHTKVYMVRESTVSGTTNTLRLFPKLVKPVAFNEQIYYGARVSMSAMYASGTKIGITYDDGILANVTGVKIVERL
jgi:hypothetical protein